VAGAICVCGPVYRFEETVVERYRPLVKAATAQLSRELGSR
jgi:DNA-binding IclR family transcriptional regulator